MSINNQSYLILKKKVTLANFPIDTNKIADCVVMTNIYILELYNIFGDLNFDLFNILGQRNLSGLIGEIFSRFFCLKFDKFCINPHPDGRPDILALNESIAHKYYYEECFHAIESTPLKSKLSPFPHGGIEVKCTLGSPITKYKEKLKKETGKNTFEIGMPRIKYLNGLNYWAHHKHSTNLLGLYYDYYSLQNNRPQILAVFYSDLKTADWNDVSIGSAEAKKTSNTSLNISGITKMYEGCLFTIKNKDYVHKLQSLGVPLAS